MEATQVERRRPAAMLRNLQEFRIRDREFQRTGILGGLPAGETRRRTYSVPWAVPAWGWSEFAAAFAAAAQGRIVRGPHTWHLAEQVRLFLGKRYALPAGQSRQGIELLLRAGGAAGGEVIMPSYVCSAVLEAVLRAGCAPVFADIGADLHINAETVAPLLNRHTRAVIACHLFGNTAPLEGIERLLEGTGILLIDDAAQSFGAHRGGRRAGSFGDAGVVSVGILKSLSGAAGGVVVTDDAAIYERLRDIPLEAPAPADVLKRAAIFWVKRFRRWTWPLYRAWERVSGMRVDVPYRLSPMADLDAAVGLAQFRKLARNAARRRAKAHLLAERYSGLAAACLSDFSTDSMLTQLVLLLPEGGPAAPEAIDLLARDGIEARMSLLPCHYVSGGPSAALPATEALWPRVLCLPVD